MNLLSRLSQFFANTIVSSTSTGAPLHQRFDCPNCWGTQEWDGIEMSVDLDLRKDTSAIGRSRQGFIQRFAERYLRRPHRRS